MSHTLLLHTLSLHTLLGSEHCRVLNIVGLIKQYQYIVGLKNIVNENKNMKKIKNKQCQKKIV